MRIVLSSVVMVAALGACVAQGPALNVQAEQMELALVECKAQLGLGGQLKTEVSFEGGVPSAKAVAFDKLTEQDAARINACADNAEPLTDGLLVVPMTAMATEAVIAPQPVAGPDVVATAPEVQAPVAPTIASRCPIGVSGMYAGTLMCIGGDN